MIQLPKPEPIDVEFEEVFDDLTEVLLQYLTAQNQRGSIIDLEV